ncbi:hypothetical protein U1Q18_001656 [Sarracenia purpurea var. burkii]
MINAVNEFGEGVSRPVQGGVNNKAIDDIFDLIHDISDLPIKLFHSLVLAAILCGILWERLKRAEMIVE